MRFLIWTLINIQIYPLMSQRIAALEKNRYVYTDSMTGNRSLSPYRLCIRELFVKQRKYWVSVDHHRNPYTGKIGSTGTIHYNLYNQGSKVVLTATRGVQELKTWQSEVLFTLYPQQDFPMNKFSDRILDGFEDSDVLEYFILQDVETHKYTRDEFKPDTFNTHQRDSITQLFGIYTFNKRRSVQTEILLDYLSNKYADKNGYRLNDSMILGYMGLKSPYRIGFNILNSYSRDNYAFVLENNGVVHWLLPDLELIEVADYDGDHKLEYLFFSSCFNTYGYVLYYDNFNQYESNIWHYH